MATIRRRPLNTWKTGSTHHPFASWPPVLPSTVAVPVLLAILGGCSPDRAAPDDAVEVLDSAGVAIVVNHGDGWSGRAGWRVSPEPTVRIGAVESPEPAEQFSFVRQVLRLSDDRIVVAEGEASEVRWFAPDGRPLATRGGRGQGPDEFTSVFALFRLPGDTVVAENRFNVRRVFFGPEMDHVRTESLDMARLAGTGTRAECQDLVLADGSLVICRPEPGLTVRPERPGHFRSYARYVRIPWTLDDEVPLGLYGGLEQWAVDAGEGRLAFQIHPFHARTAVAVGTDPVLVAIAVNPAYSIELWTPEGRLERIVRYPAAERAPDPDQLGEARAGLVERMAEWGEEETLQNRFLREMEEPTLIPSVQGLTLGPGGELWVRRDPAVAAPGAWRYDVFDAGGRFLGPVSLPERFLLHEVGSDYLLGVRIDELNVPFVELYALERGV